MSQESYNLPDTQLSDNENIVFSQDFEIPLIWGRLFPTRKNVPSLDLLKEEYSIGRSPSCDLVLRKDFLKPDVLNAMSKYHCSIKREEVSGVTAVYLYDHSANGTHVNGEMVGKGKRVILQNDDLISLAFPNFKAFVFIDYNGLRTKDYPEEVTSKYVISRKLGSGAHGDVYLTFDRKTSKLYAMKIVTKKSMSNCPDKSKIMNEVNVLRRIDHPYIIHIYDAIECHSELYIVLEFMDGGTLFDRIRQKGSFQEDDCKSVFYQIVIAVQYLHSRGISHRDLKPENILLKASEKHGLTVKLADFGLSKYMEATMQMTTICGTLYYAAPEVLEAKRQGRYTNQADVWSLGVILYVCLSGNLPFHENKNLPVIEQIKKGLYSFPTKLFGNVSRDAVNLIKKMLTVNPYERITINNVLNHSWMKNMPEVQQTIEGAGQN